MFDQTKQYNSLSNPNGAMVDRRSNSNCSEAMWDKLNLSQQYAVCSLSQFGYLLTYVRSFSGNAMAILKQNDKVATVNALGVINITPSIMIR